MKRHLALYLFLCILLCLPLSACNPKAVAITKEGFYFDTIISITIYNESYSPYVDDCFAMAAEAENLFSATKINSDITNINANAPNPVVVNEDTLELIKKALSFCEISHGAFDISIGNVSRAWDFSATEYNTVPDETLLSSLSSHVCYENVKIKGNTVALTDDLAALDLGGIAKGWIADKMKAYLLSQGVKSGIINLGGNVLLLGPKDDGTDYVVGVQQPFETDGTPAFTITASDVSIVTSGTYQRYFVKEDILYHHILDPKSGYPVNNQISSATIVTKNSADADALSTVCFVLGIKDGLALVESLDDTEVIYITNEDEIIASSGMGTDIPMQIL